MMLVGAKWRQFKATRVTGNPAPTEAPTEPSKTSVKKKPTPRKRRGRGKRRGKKSPGKIVVRFISMHCRIVEIKMTHVDCNKSLLQLSASGLLRRLRPGRGDSPMRYMSEGIPSGLPQPSTRRSS